MTVDERGKSRPLRPVTNLGGPWRPSDDVEAMLCADAVWATLPAGFEQRVMRAATAVRPGVDTGLAPAMATSGRPVRTAAADRTHRLGGSLRALLSRRLPRRTGLVLVAASVTAVAGAVGLAGYDWSDRAGTMRLTATERAPGAAADVSVRDTPSGVEITMDTSGLPPAPAGTFYQAWVVGPGGSVAIGTFHLRGGSNEVVLWSGVGLDRYTRITVTTQQEGAGPASSGKVLLAGDVPTTLR